MKIFHFHELTGIRQYRYYGELENVVEVDAKQPERKENFEVGAVVELLG